MMRIVKSGHYSESKLRDVIITVKCCQEDLGALQFLYRQSTCANMEMEKDTTAVPRHQARKAKVDCDSFDCYGWYCNWSRSKSAKRAKSTTRKNKLQLCSIREDFIQIGRLARGEMALTLAVIFQCIILCANALAVLHEERFLKRGK